jgi:hypothetical protein
MPIAPSELGELFGKKFNTGIGCKAYRSPFLKMNSSPRRCKTIPRLICGTAVVEKSEQFARSLIAAD